MNKWLLLACAILCEVTGSLSMKAATSQPGWYALVAAGYIAAFTFLSMVLRAGVPLGVAYGIWGALGVALTAVLGALFFGEALTLTVLGGIVLIVGGVLLVELGSKTAKQDQEAAQP
jgi:small multidrug resistance pump